MKMMRALADTPAERPRSLLKALVDEIDKALWQIARVDDITYCRRANGTGSVGEQFRHNLDLINSFLNGIESGKVDYVNRERSRRIETKRGVAEEMFRRAARQIERLEPSIVENAILVRSEVDTAKWHTSSIGRELEFVHSHTVHHHALIAEKLAGYGIDARENFGVAPSTLAYWNTSTDGC